jgi:malonyl-CoA O-methyltransferase
MNPESEIPASEPFFADRGALLRNFNRAAANFARGDALHREVAARMHERLGYIKLQPARVLDLGCATGAAATGLRARFPKTQITGVDFALKMAQLAGRPEPWFARVRGASRTAVCADMAALPLAHSSFGLVWSNLALHWLDDPEPALREAHRVLEMGGLLMFSTLGPDTLKELRAAWEAAEAAVYPGTTAGWHVKRFIDLHDIGDLLVQTGFATPVMDMEKVVLTYDTAEGLMVDLRATGSVNALRGRGRGLTGKVAWREMIDRLEAGRAGRRLPATFEVVYGHAWKAPTRKTAGGDDVVRFFDRGPGGALR